MNPRPAPPAPPRAPRILQRPAALALACALLGPTACSTTGLPSLEALPGPTDLPFIHKIDVQQGNVVTQDMLAKLQRGMDKKKVTFVMGTPIIRDTFNADRWDYVYSYKPGGGRAEGRRVTLVFVDDRLDHIEGDVKPAEGRLITDTRPDTTVEVPLWKKPSMVARIRNKIPFVDPADPEYEYELPENEQAEEEEPEVDEQEKLTAGLDGEEAILVPKDAPTNKKKKGFFARLADSIGIGAEEDEEEGEYDPGDPKYRDITNPDDL